MVGIFREYIEVREFYKARCRELGMTMRTLSRVRRIMRTIDR